MNGTAYAGKSTMVKMLSERFGGIFCGENYHDALMDAIDPAHQPSLSYFSTMSGWQEFISRTPEAYERWADGCTQECAEMEIILLLRLASQGKRVFVDTNIPLDWLREIADPKHVLIMLSPQETSVNRFFDRPDPEKQFLMRQIAAAPDSDAAKRNFLACIARINSRERYDALLHSGFQTLLRDDCRTKEETLLLVAQCFGLI